MDKFYQCANLSIFWKKTSDSFRIRDTLILHQKERRFLIFCIFFENCLIRYNQNSVVMDKTAAICIKPFVDTFDYDAGSVLTADETYIRIRDIKQYVCNYKVRLSLFFWLCFFITHLTLPALNWYKHLLYYITKLLFWTLLTSKLDKFHLLEYTYYH